MVTIAEQIAQIRTTLPENVTLVCVSKFQPVEAIREAYKAGERHFGESRVQELQRKKTLLPEDVQWHFIGHLQTNKVRDLLQLRPYLIQSVDSVRLLQAIDKEAAKQGIVQNVLLELHVAKEETKTGFTPEELSAVSSQLSAFTNIRVLGLMTMATNTDDETEIRRCFTEAKQSFSEAVFQQSGPTAKRSFSKAILSMGMSDDYSIAIECGSNMVRIGSSIFGERDYHQPPITDHQCHKLRAVFFDQDGVLYNSMPYHAKAWVWAMNKHGLPYTELETYRNEGRTGSGVIQELHQRMYGTDATPEHIEAIYADKSKRFIEISNGFPGVIPNVQGVLHFLHEHDVECWVVTGSGQRNLINALNKTFDNVFKGIISSYDVQYGKPNPEPYLKAWKRSGWKKEECFVVENAPLGVRAAKAAGLFTIAVNTGILPDEELAAEHPDQLFHNMEELLQWLKQVIN
ncbi:MAG: YggS family pyridoxal phosphate-dependent enzyme [Paludibacteraceae bacterium]|nr:YggS family pyridoxal phosphate-dependent enzyme [Paludibacteraceae bacterium]